MDWEQLGNVLVVDIRPARKELKRDPVADDLHETWQHPVR
jgi:hypothetical protein